jgi:hypothetical protein
VAERPKMHNWADASKYMAHLEAENDRLRSSLNEACDIALGTDLAREAVDRIRTLQRT